MTDENKVGVEVAEQEFDRWVEAMDLDLDTAAMDAEDLTAFNKQKRRLIKAMRRGSLVINENGEAEFTPQNENTRNKDTLTFHERTGASLMAMDGKKKGHDAAKTYAIMADICKTHPSTFAGMVGEDVKVCEALFAFLMD